MSLLNLLGRFGPDAFMGAYHLLSNPVALAAFKDIRTRKANDPQFALDLEAVLGLVVADAEPVHAAAPVAAATTATPG